MTAPAKGSRHPGQALRSRALALLNLAFGECAMRNSTGRAETQRFNLSFCLLCHSRAGGNPVLSFFLPEPYQHPFYHRHKLHEIHLHFSF